MAMAPLDKPREALIERAKEIIQSVGYKERPEDTAAYWTRDLDYLDHVEQTDKSPDRWTVAARAQPPVVSFLYRQSPRPLVPISPPRRVGGNDPPFTVSGMVNVSLDSEGRLISFRAVAPAVCGREGARAGTGLCSALCRGRPRPREVPGHAPELG